MTGSNRGGQRPRAALAVGVLAALVGSLTAAPAHAAPAPELFCDLPGQELAISPLTDLTDGQAVTWLSTVKGTTPTEFTGEYVGRLENGLGYDAYGQPRDLLLVKLSGDVVDGTAGSLAAGVWAGASGSPVYDADGALIGAVSYGFSNIADNVAGVTPAAYMKSIGDLPLSRTLSSSAQRQVARMTAEKPTSSASTTIRQLPTVRVTTGTTARTLDDVADALASEVRGYRPVASRGLAIDGGTADGADYPIVTGGNIAVSYSYGAIGSASVGTVTAVCGDDVWAFGHPGEWNSALTANIHGASAARIVPDLGSSYKMVSAIGKVKGTLVEDRLAGIRATLGAGTATIPVTTVSIAGDHTSTAISRVSEKLLLPQVAASQLGTDATRLLDNQWEGAAKVAWQITYRRESGAVATLNNVNRYSDPQLFSELVGWDVAEDIAQLQANPYEDVTVLGVRIRARYAEGYRAGRISAVQMRTSSGWKNVASGSVTKVSRNKTYSFRVVLSPAPGSVRTTEYTPFTVVVPSTVKRIVAVSVGSPVPRYDEPTDARTFAGFIAALDDNARMDVVNRTRSYQTLSGSRYAGRTQTVTPTIVQYGTRISFQLEVPAAR